MASLYPQTQREQALVLVGILGVGLAALFWYLRYDPRTVELDLLQERIAALEVANQRAKVILARGTVSEIKAEAEALKADLELMRTLVPVGNEVPALLEQVSTAARRVGLDIGPIEPRGVERGTDFDAYRYKFRLNGSYHTVSEFLTRVASLPRIVAPMNVVYGTPTINATPRPGTMVPTVAASFELHTYVARVSADSTGGAP